MITWAKIILIALQCVKMLLDKAQADEALRKADENAIARVTLQILKRTQYAKHLDEVSDDLSDADLEQRVRALLRN
jgi:hypothetical protein